SFDRGVDRDQRQFFFDIGKPTSEAFVEVGLLSHGGGFARIARSGRAVFPRREPAPWRDAEWMTVRAGRIEGANGHRGVPAAEPSPPTAGAPSGEHSDPRPYIHVPSPGEAASGGGPHFHAILAWEELVWGELAWERQLWESAAEIHRIVTWEGDTMVSSWEA